MSQLHYDIWLEHLKDFGGFKFQILYFLSQLLDFPRADHGGFFRVTKLFLLKWRLRHFRFPQFSDPFRYQKQGKKTGCNTGGRYTDDKTR